MSQSESRRVAHCMYVEIEFKKKKKKKRNFDFESLVLRKFRKITAISHPCYCVLTWSVFSASKPQTCTATKLHSLQHRSVHHTASLVLWLRCPPRERKIPGLNPACAGIFSGSSHISDLKIGTPVATLPGAWCYRVSAGTSWPGVSIL